MGARASRPAQGADAGGDARAPSVRRRVHGVDVLGIDIDAETRCRHYAGPTDVIALKFYCCNAWYPCIDCHRAVADHAPGVWPVSEREERAILCGVCGHQLTIAAYLACESTCPECGAGFNPGCALHHHLYFESGA